MTDLTQLIDSYLSALAADPRTPFDKAIELDHIGSRIDKARGRLLDEDFAREEARERTLGQ